MAPNLNLYWVCFNVIIVAQIAPNMRCTSAKGENWQIFCNKTLFIHCLRYDWGPARDWWSSSKYVDFPEILCIQNQMAPKRKFQIFIFLYFFCMPYLKLWLEMKWRPTRINWSSWKYVEITNKIQLAPKWRFIGLLLTFEWMQNIVWCFG